MRLVADIGGTNSRLALAPTGSVELTSTRSYVNADYKCFDNVISDYLSNSNATVKQLVIAMAGPVRNNVGRLTNLDWEINGNKLAQSFGTVPALVINDLTALGHSALKLAPNQVSPIVNQPVINHRQKQALVIGIGTGFNVSPVIEFGGVSVCAEVEAGHTTLFSSILLELENLMTGMSHAFSTVESLFSGRGRRQFMSLLTGERVDSASMFIDKQGILENQAYDHALDRYAELIGMLIAEFKVSYLPHDGIFLAGGVARSSLTRNRTTLCAEAAMCENDVIKLKPPVWSINDDAAALVGCASLKI
jgi:glucokinase